ncbi:hypothetical protein ACH5RR_028141 [Cinchona calisaya]|uniref:Uncharacterized protein n=1 Tax=Cinchona calisaya TaxID=153742 RepID=A0ABD2YRI0_9GENT
MSFHVPGLGYRVTENLFLLSITCFWELFSKDGVWQGTRKYTLDSHVCSHVQLDFMLTRLTFVLPHSRKKTREVRVKVAKQLLDSLTCVYTATRRSPLLKKERLLAGVKKDQKGCCGDPGVLRFSVIV